MKKTTDTKKSLDDADDASGPASSGGSSSAKATTKEDDDVYEFKTTPKDTSSSSGDDKSDGGKGSDKSSDEKSDDQGTKRSYSDIEGDGDDDVKRKKRKDASEASTKDAATNKNASNRAPSLRQEKNSKTPNTAVKNSNLTNKNVAALDRKSPSGSPKPNSTKADSDAEMDDKGDAFTPGPKVPPLKIVIPQQTSNADQETGGTRNGKSVSTRNHAALPYVVASSSNSNDSADKESVSSRCTSPSDSTKGGTADDKKTTAAMQEEQKQQRVLRSSNRGGQSVDRGSNNSSPQMQSSSPSPAPVTQASTTTSSTTTTTTTSTVSGETGNSDVPKSTTTSTTSATPANNPTNTSSPNNTNVNSESETTCNAPSPSASSTSSTKESSQNAVELHPRKRKIRASKDDNKQSTNTNPSSTQSNHSSTDTNENVTNNEIHPHEQPITNCYQMYLTIRKQIERRHRMLFPVQPKPPQGFKHYLLNRGTYVLAGKTPIEPVINLPANLATQMKEMFTQQEKDRHKLKMQHVVEKEKLVLSVEQEILRVHGRAARALANQSLPFSACTILKDEEVYNMITPEQEEKDRNARSRYNGRLFLSWLQDVDDKWEKIKVNRGKSLPCGKLN